MAWQAKLSQPVQTTQDKIYVVFDYYDDVDPTTMLASQSFTFDPAWTNANMHDAVVGAGQQLRTAYTKASTLSANFPVGTVIAIP